MDVLKWFYCLDIPDALALMAAGTAAFLALKMWLGHRRFWNPVVCCLVVLWLAAIVYVTVARRESAGTQESLWIPFWSYYLAFGGNRELLRSNLMNVLLFYPAGLLAGSLLPKDGKRWRGILLMAAGGCALSLAIELSQYALHLGLAETDDVIHNTLGAALGILAGSRTLKK